MKFHAKVATPANHPCDVFIAPHFAESKTLTGALKELDRALNGYISTVIGEEGFEGRPGQNLMVHTHGMISPKRVLVLGLGTKAALTTEAVRRAAAVAVRASQAVHADDIAVELDPLASAKLPLPELAQAFTEGAALGSYQFLKYKSQEERDKAAKAAVQLVHLIGSNAAAVRKLTAGAERGFLGAEATMMVRDLVNEPAVAVTPKDLARAAEQLGKIPGVTVTVYNETAIRKLKMGSFLSVAAGSDEEPYLVHLSYKPRGKKAAKKLALCGKGITFDSGGLSIKPSQYMESMKQDMAGAGIILGVFSVITQLKPNVELHGVFAATENMPSGKATRPGDIVRAYNGKTIEVTNTDAEGRLILADALSWTVDTIKPDYIVDLATLTGAAIVALGQEVAAVMGNSERLTQQYLAASQQAGEQHWELPLVEEYATELLKSPVADLSNSPRSHWAGSIVGGLFLREFVGETPWLHVDIAGPAWAEKQVLPYAPFGGTGFGVRTVLNLLTTLR
jgi:leucyl aminopeptidase